jgi:hypothetical protein
MRASLPPVIEREDFRSPNETSEVQHRPYYGLRMIGNTTRGKMSSE